MGNEVLGQINKTVRAFITHDRQLAKEIIEADAKINEFELKLEQKSLEIIALQQPVSADLRAVRCRRLAAVSGVDNLCAGIGCKGTESYANAIVVRA